MWEKYLDVFPLAHETGYKIIQVSMGANGVRWGTAEADDLLSREIEIQALANWQLIAMMPSEAKERVNLKFVDMNVREFTCRLVGKFLGDFDLDKLIKKLSMSGVMVEVHEFELSE